MARNAAINVENNFIKGLITEATGLNFPENASVETFDCIFDQTGAVSRRHGFEDEPDTVTTSVTRNNSAITEFIWNSVGGDGNINFLVQQVGSTLYYYKINPYTGLSSQKKSFTTDITTFQVNDGISPSSEFCQFTSGNGWLFVAHKYCDPFYVAYDALTDSVTATKITVKIRDMEGIDDGYDVDERSDALTREHLYNIFNQGWYAKVGNATTQVWPEIEFSGWALQPEGTGHHPANCDVWWTFKDSSGNMLLSEANHIARPKAHAPKGHYIVDAFNIDRTAAFVTDADNRAAGYNTYIDVVTSSYFRPPSIEFFSQRIWYAGPHYTGYNNKIYYSQIIQGASNIDRCYQENDPTSERLSDLLATDGGYIVIPDIGNIVKLVSVQGSLLVFASNGVWAVTGSSQGAGFKATDFAVSKLSVNENRSPLSFVRVNGIPIWWGQDSIYTVQVDPTLGSIQVTPVIEKSIKTFYNNIPGLCKEFAKGIYNQQTKVISWVYRNTEGSTLDDNQNYDRVLNLNTVTGAFYPWTIPSSSKKINSIVAVHSLGLEIGPYDVVDSSGNLVVNSGSVQVVSDFSSLGAQVASTKFLTTKVSSGTTYDMNWAEAFSNKFKDWYNLDDTGVDYTSYFDTGYKVHGQGSNRFEADFITVYMLSETNSSCYLRTIRNYANSTATGLYSSLQQVYNSLMSNHVYAIRRIRARGAGKVMKLRFTSESGKPFTVIGWSAFETSNTLP